MLTFNLKKEWFEKIKSGEKTHEYREYKPYWRNRLEKCIGYDFSATRLRFGNPVVIEYPHYITFVCGYAPKGDRNKRLKARLISIRLVDGRETDLHINKPVYDIKFELIKELQMTDKEIIIDGKIIGCPCYIDRPLHRYHKGCLVQSQAFKEQQTEEKPILRCDEIKNCPIKENFKQLQCKTAECEKLKVQLKNSENAVKMGIIIQEK